MLVYWTTLAFLSLLTLVWNDKWMANPFNIGEVKSVANWWINPVFQFILRHHFHQFMLSFPPSKFETQNHVELLQSFLLHLILNDDGLELLRSEIFFSRCETKENYLSEFIPTFPASNIQKSSAIELLSVKCVKCKKGGEFDKEDGAAAKVV